MPYEDSDEGAISLPQPHGSIKASGSDGGAVWTIRHSMNPIGMPCQGSDGGAISLPQPYGVVTASGSDGGTIRTVRYIQEEPVEITFKVQNNWQQLY